MGKKLIINGSIEALNKDGDLSPLVTQTCLTENPNYTITSYGKVNYSISESDDGLGGNQVAVTEGNKIYCSPVLKIWEDKNNDAAKNTVQINGDLNMRGVLQLYDKEISGGTSSLGGYSMNSLKVSSRSFYVDGVLSSQPETIVYPTYDNTCALGTESNKFKEIRCSQLYCDTIHNATIENRLDDLEARLTSLGFKQGYIQFEPEDEWIRQYVTLSAESENNIIKRQGNYVLIRLNIDWHVSGAYTETYSFKTNSFYQHKLGRIVSNNTNPEYLFPPRTYTFGAGGEDVVMNISSSSSINVVPCIEIRNNGDVYLALYGDGKSGRVYTPRIAMYDDVTILGGYEANPL